MSAVERNLLDRSLIDHLSNGDRRRFDGGSIAGDRHFLSNAADFESEVSNRDLPHFERQAANDLRFHSL